MRVSCPLAGNKEKGKFIKKTRARAPLKRLGAGKDPVLVVK